MRLPLSLRFVLPLGLVLALFAYSVVPLVDTLTFRWFVRDLEARERLIAATTQEPLGALIVEKSPAKILSYFDRMIQDERLYAIGLCALDGSLGPHTLAFPKQVTCSTLSQNPGISNSLLTLERGPLHIASAPIEYSGDVVGNLVIVHDMSLVLSRSADTKKYVFYLFAILASVISIITVVIAQLSWRGWVSGARALFKGEGLFKPLMSDIRPEFRPLAKDLKRLINDLEVGRRARDESQISWTPEALRVILNQELAGEEILIVSNREPYEHVKRDNKIELQIPASGLVTALEPVMRACSGTWIAHGSGSGDREAVNRNDRVMVPPEDPSYCIRRVWLSPEEEAGYYYGFSNEGLWPLCHIAHTRPIFRSSDWKQYEAVNQKFAEAVLVEAKTKAPVILVQDYHFALLPRMIRDRLPDATIITFWHIPWPNPEAFGICPWREELLSGLLGSNILGFHTRFHRNNFIDSVDRFLEARIDREMSTISTGGKLTAVKHYPISIEWPVRWLEGQKSVPECRNRIRQLSGLASDRMIGLGVDRLDYTKGIVERFLAVERLFELEPSWIGRFTFVQIAAPSRSSIGQYQAFEGQVRALAERINQKYGREGCPAIDLKIEHHGGRAVFEYFRAADVCMVSSLHDGMNLVAKEFVAARDDERGVLILSQFAGASRELPEALIVNPYDIDQCAVALHVALSMPPSEQRVRMKSMRGLIQEYNVYRWAGRMLIDAARMREKTRFLNRVQNSARKMVNRFEL